MLKVKFHLLPEGDKPCYQHDVVSIAEGLKLLGVEYYGNGNYWFDHNSNDYLIKKAPDTFVPDINIYNSIYFERVDTCFSTIVKNSYNILLDFSDGYKTISSNEVFRHFKLILKTHYNNNFKYEKNVYPWAFGITNRILEENDKWLGSEVFDEIFVNYRAYYDIRGLARKKLDRLLLGKYRANNYITDPYDNGFARERREREERKANSYWWQTFFRHDPEYYRLLNSSRFTYAFGGGLIPRTFLKDHLQYSEVLLKFYRKKSIIDYFLGNRRSNNYINYQYDSWRFWEALISNSIPIQLDFNDWGLILPQMPISGVHYFGVKGLDFEQTANMIVTSSKSDLQQIAVCGRDWAIQNYTAKPVADRFIGIINDLNK